MSMQTIIKVNEWCVCQQQKGLKLQNAIIKRVRIYFCACSVPAGCVVYRGADIFTSCHSNVNFKGTY